MDVPEGSFWRPFWYIDGRSPGADDDIAARVQQAGAKA
jgi:hypothetical protein